MRPPALRTALPALLLAGALLAAAVVAADAPLLGGGARQGVSDAARTGALVVFAVVVFAVGMVAALASAAQRAEAHGARRRRGPFAQSMALVVAVVVLLLATMGSGWLVADFFQGDGARTPARGQPCQGSEKPCAEVTPDRRVNERDEPVADRGTPVWLLVGVALAWLVAFPLALYRLARGRPPAGEQDGVTAAAAEAALAAIAPPRDDREAILAAYAAMERTFAAAGHARDPSEAPREYLARMLTRLDGDRAGASRRLTARFEHARFATDPVTPADRREAEAALDALRREPRRAGGTVVVARERPA